MNDLGIIESFKNNVFPGGIGAEGQLGLNGYCDTLLQYALLLAGTITIIMVGVQVITYFANPSKDMDPYILIRPILILAALSLYSPLVSLLLDQPTQFITDFVEQSALEVTDSSSAKTFEKFFLDKMTTMRQDDDSFNILSVDPILEVIHILIMLLALSVSLYIMIRQILLLGVYYIMGLFVLPFSLVPGNQEILKRWFFGFLAVFLWIPVLRILQTIIILINHQTFNDGSGTSGLTSLVLQFCCVFFVLMTPKFANMLVSGSGDSDSSGWLLAFGREVYYRRLGGMGGLRNRMRGK